MLYSQDWIRSTNYLERPRLLSKFESLFKGSKQWLLHLHAPGGSGKTAFLQWLISRRLVVERRGGRRVPVGRVDMDHIDLALTRRWPWLLLVPIVQQLNLQLPFAPFERLLSRFRPIEDVVRRPAISGAISGAPASSLSSREQQDILTFLESQSRLFI